MFRIVCDPSSGSIELYLTEIIRGVSQMFIVCLVGVWQRNFEPVVCVCTVRRTVPALWRTAPQGSPRTPAKCIAATTPGLIVRILKCWF